MRELQVRIALVHWLNNHVLDPMPCVSSEIMLKLKQ